MSFPLRIDVREFLEGAGYTLSVAGRSVLRAPHLWRRRREVFESVDAHDFEHLGEVGSARAEVPPCERVARRNSLAVN